ncbi:D-alanyl-D-alanine carboxypeptidase/D-alanyl-D-alanine endopeptidase [Phormidium sp. CCY1219]|uniref:D-alanyl-D-alanine carboxypeptidase/D-alanyl-D-alanine endopeptidase n=1 Tax=Phormidium sp. CCY1219 TaxID=2886104 RepID=UPI002D1EC5B9|nr:D-alanyl-D-alanine carboxypeptidase/D-alanyl-D-alanine-endopeptidase [Phormidium sp. CCY1219]MEB3831349.1 D-alanyl-D-alanine carboxypeptidase/D-alanyl-D-alanine-endopeptidase [Phormidium sp. CCY1219]
MARLLSLQKTHNQKPRSRKPGIFGLICGIIAGMTPTVAVAEAPGICQSRLEPAIAQIINRPELRRSRWGILVETLDSGSNPTLYQKESDRYFIPASNAKLLTSAAALHHLGSNFRIRTSVYGKDSTPGNLEHLRIVGRGDPSITASQLEAIAEQLHNQGIEQIGQIIADDSYFRGLPFNPNWEWEDVQAGYGAPVNSLIYNQNAIELKVWPQNQGDPLRVTWADPREGMRWRIENNAITVASSQPEFLEVGRDFATPVIRLSGQLRAGSEPEDIYVATPHPGNFFLRHFREALAKVGITAGRGLVTHEATPSSAQRELATIESPPLSELVMQVNQKSNNLYAEVLLRSLGTNPGNKAKKALPEETIAAGLQVLEAALSEIGVDSDSYELVDGSGLSRQNLVSPEALVQTLRAFAYSPNSEIYRNSLPVGGVSGTLRWRFRDTPGEGKVRAKTGTLTGVSALSGYVPNSEYDTLIFSIMVNQSDRRARQLRQAIDEIVLLLTQMRRC